MFNGLWPEYIGSWLAPQDVYGRIGYVACQYDQGNNYGHDDPL
jgi:hypothetical protein